MQQLASCSTCCRGFQPRRRPDVVDGDSCGRYCSRPCREWQRRYAESPRAWRTCTRCGERFFGRRRRYCTDDCRRFAHGQIRGERSCRLVWRRCSCGRDFPVVKGCEVHCRECRRGIANKRSASRRHRDEVLARDRWRCHLCGERIPVVARWPHPRSASLDHVVPVADGGADDPENLAAAHLECNWRRGARPIGVAA